MHDEKPDIRGLEAEAYLQGGYFSIAQASVHRVSRQLLNHYVTHGRFERIGRGLYRINGFPRSDHDEMREKWMMLGQDNAVLSHESALALLELSDNLADEVHLLVPRSRRGLRRLAGVVIHTRPNEEQVATVWRDGLPLTAPARTLVDVAGEIQPDQAMMAIRQALERGLVTRSQLEHEAMQRRRPQLIARLLPDR